MKNNIYTSSRFAFATLIIANILTILFFVVGNGSIIQVLWSYWLQSVIIGLVAIARLLDYPPKGEIIIDGKPFLKPDPDVEAGFAARLLYAGFFTFHYGIFHFVYMTFLISFSMSNVPFNVFGQQTILNLGSGTSIGAILLSGLAFALHHFLSFSAERKYLTENPAEIPKTQDILIKPYSRILPMHVIIIFGPVVSVYLGNEMVLVVFMVLKTIADWKLFAKGTSHPLSRQIAS